MNLAAVHGDSLRSLLPTRRVRLTDESRATAAPYSAIIGFGVGHRMLGVGAAGKLFRTRSSQALQQQPWVGNGFAGEGPGGPIFYAGAGVFVVSRLLEIGDVLTRAEESGVKVVPLIDRRRGGAALQNRF